MWILNICRWYGRTCIVMAEQHLSTATTVPRSMLVVLAFLLAVTFGGVLLAIGLTTALIQDVVESLWQWSHRRPAVRRPLLLALACVSLLWLSSCGTRPTSLQPQPPLWICPAPPARLLTPPALPVPLTAASS